MFGPLTEKIDTSDIHDANWYESVSMAVLIVLIALFGLQHSVMARPRFKQWLTRYIPEHAERSTFMLATAIVTFALIVLWQPVPTTVGQADKEQMFYLMSKGIGEKEAEMLLVKGFLESAIVKFGDEHFMKLVQNNIEEMIMSAS